MSDDEKPQKNPLGPTGHRVRENIQRIRTERRLTYRELSDRLADLGRSIPTLGLSRIENGTRRVDADDLVALAIALDVSPLALLMPAQDSPIDLAAGVRIGWKPGWRWAAGEHPLVAERRRQDEQGREVVSFDRIDLADPRVVDYVRANRPFESDPIDEAGMFLLARLGTKPFRAEIRHDGDGRISGDVTLHSGQDADGER
ncbi:helix-turn-helix transcriptional regulator [Verrucosispora sp. WMMD1129]|uniref:helix-turn-helix domain-containing protein n=1 Tax=Verrucosispora sp. WMMD1129 TaxID=3016093 RepID=UPI00249AA5B3|nr:helix-turn-helix transcriptional regulator [Verrucosispora sp. WMMD1129]WFE46277.1 helix-turn-helix transcriptional regulator [Verrucosispora sp. WMMD1129]